jgi:hypothetical protein
VGEEHRIEVGRSLAEEEEEHRIAGEGESRIAGEGESRIAGEEALHSLADNFLVVDLGEERHMVVARSLVAEAGLRMVVAQEGRHNLADSPLGEGIDLGAASHMVVEEEEDIAVHTEVEGNLFCYQLMIFSALGSSTYVHAGERHRGDVRVVDKPCSRFVRFD